MKERLHSLDYLRGLMAFGIMIFHLFTWAYGSFAVSTFLGRIGLYGVSIFYVLSGLTLYLVNYKNLTFSSVKDFFIKRFFRIMPLIWFCLVLHLVVLRRSHDVWELLLNASGLFGFVYIDKYLILGSWSIGNELFFYSLFPFVLLLSKKFKYLLQIYFLISLAIAVYYAYFLITPLIPASQQWIQYINPLNQLFFFAGGMLMGHLLKGKTLPRKYGIPLLIFLAFSFIFYPAEGVRFNLILGSNRIIFALISILVTLCFYVTDISFGKKLNRVFSWLGEISYSVYLLHPIVQSILYSNIKQFFSPPVFIAIVILTTLLLSHYAYKYFEQFFIQYARKTIKIRKEKAVIKPQRD